MRHRNHQPPAVIERLLYKQSIAGGTVGLDAGVVTFVLLAPRIACSLHSDDEVMSLIANLVFGELTKEIEVGRSRSDQTGHRCVANCDLKVGLRNGRGNVCPIRFGNRGDDVHERRDPAGQKLSVATDVEGEDWFTIPGKDKDSRWRGDDPCVAIGSMRG